MNASYNQIPAENALQTAPIIDASSSSILSVDALNSLGLKNEDIPEIKEIANRISPYNPLTVAEFGRDIAEHTAQYTDHLLSQVKNSDLEEAGEKLNKVLSTATALNMNALSNRRSKIPFIGKWIDKVKSSTGNFMGQFETTKEQIDSLISEVEFSQKGLSQRNLTLEEMFVAVVAEHRLLGIHIAAGKLRLKELQSDAIQNQSQQLSPTQVQKVADLDSLIASLDKRVGDLLALQHSALQSLPTIRIIQANNQMLVDKFHTIREITVPAWKRQFMLALSLNEQRNSVELATSIDDATNDLLNKNASLLHRNSIATAQSNQRLVIDIDTLKEVQNTLIKTVEDVLIIQQEGVAKRRNAEVQLEAMRAELQSKLAKR